MSSNPGFPKCWIPEQNFFEEFSRSRLLQETAPFFSAEGPGFERSLTPYLSTEHIISRRNRSGGKTGKCEIYGTYETFSILGMLELTR